MKKYRIILSLLACIYRINNAQEAVCISPVTDLTGDRLINTEDNKNAFALNGPSQQIKRIDQLLFNERVNLLETNGETVRIHVPSHGYGEPYNNIIHHEFWTDKKNIVLLDALEDRSAIPSSENIQNVITLLQPFHDNKHHRTYSMGTPFVLDEIQDNPQEYRILLLSPQLKTGHVYIPKELCAEITRLGQAEKINQFINILNFVADQPNGYVPYVLGGNSFVQLYKNGSVTKDEITTLCTAQFPTKDNVHSGFDCASLIHRAALTAGIPINVKNSSGLKNTLKKLQSDDSVENGDIIYIPGHIIVLADKDNDMVIEARTQTHGYGYVHKIPLAELFKEIPDTQTLIKYHHSKELVSRLDADHKTIARVPITILKLKSAFEPEIPVGASA